VLAFGRISRRGERRSSIPSPGWQAGNAIREQLDPILDAEWEKLSILLTFLIPKLPAPTEKDQSRGLLETVDMDSYRSPYAARDGHSLRTRGFPSMRMRPDCNALGAPFFT
jgi:hypothetical protein